MTPADRPLFPHEESVLLSPCDPSNVLSQAGVEEGSARRLSDAAERIESKSALTAFAFAEYHRLRASGQTPDISEWCALFPTCRSALRKVLEVEALLGSRIDDLVKGSCDESLDWPGEGEQREGFVVLRELARGAFARVYLATDPATGNRLVVLKCSTLGGAEARTMGRLSHPGIVQIYWARHDENSGLTLVCMPYHGSTTLEDVLDRLRMCVAAPVPFDSVRNSRASVPPSLPTKAAFLLDVIRSCAQPEDPPAPIPDARLRRSSYTDGVVHLAVQLAQTLAFLHKQNVFHRDLKPSNVLLDPSGRPLLLDFNLSESETETDTPIGGTLRYMAPEQLNAFLNSRPNGMDGRADLFALALIVYELLTAEYLCDDLPAESFAPAQARFLLEQKKKGFQSFRRVCPDLERPVAAILDRCLAFDVAQRPQTADELVAELKRQFSPVRRFRRWLAAHRGCVLATLGLFSVALATLSYVWAITPPYSQREYDRGRLAYQMGEYEAAEKHFERALHSDPSEDRFRVARGCARLQQSKFSPLDQVKFDQIYDDLRSKEERLTDARTLSVNAYLQLRRQHFDEAITIYTNPTLSGYRPVMVLNNRAYGYTSKFQLEKARFDLDQAVKLDPHCQAVRYNRALAIMYQRKLRKIPTIPRLALEDIDQALKFGPASRDLYRDAALLYALAAKDENNPEQLEHAENYLRQAVSLGANAAQFAHVSSLREALKRPDFVSLLASPPLNSSPQPELRLIDPVEFPE